MKDRIRGFTIVMVFDLAILTFWEIEHQNYLFAFFLACSAVLHVIQSFRATAPKLSQRQPGVTKV